MSVDSGTDRYGERPRDLGCSLCGQRLGAGEDLLVQCYPEAERARPTAATDCCFLAVCPDCALEVDELVDSWTGHADPPVAAEWSISDGYRRVTDDCSFCARALGEDPLLGVEYYRRRGADDEPESYANYSLCGDCVPVFDEFLTQVGGDGAM